MNILSILPSYVRWHYTKGFGDVARFDRRLLRRVESAFAPKFLLKTFFMPLKRMGEGYAKNDPSSWASTFIVNTLMRLFGMMVRFVLLVVAFFVSIIAGVVAATIFVAWIFLPLIVPTLFIMGVSKLFL